MSSATIFIGAAALVVSFVLTYCLKRAAKYIGLIDFPNERSSHDVPTPRGGGLAIVLASIVAMAVLTVSGVIPLRLFLALGGGGAMVAAVGFIDDCRSLSAAIRLLVHFVAAGWAVAWLGPVTHIELGSGNLSLGVFAYPMSTLAIVWFLNMFNFMDGIDGIAASQSVFMCAALAILAWHWEAQSSIAPAALMIGAASVGFLVWNWPPAKIFMGDVGSGYLGFSLAVLGLAVSAHHPSAPWSWLIVAGVFAIDATLTVIRRFLRGERVTAPHRTHAFQRLAKKFGHDKVTASIILINFAWILPCALLSVHSKSDVFWIAILALTPLLISAFAVGAGSAAPESTARAAELPSATIVPFSLFGKLLRSRARIAPAATPLKAKVFTLSNVREQHRPNSPAFDNSNTEVSASGTTENSERRRELRSIPSTH